MSFCSLTQQNPTLAGSPRTRPKLFLIVDFDFRHACDMIWDPSGLVQYSSTLVSTQFGSGGVELELSIGIRSTIGPETTARVWKLELEGVSPGVH